MTGHSKLSLEEHSEALSSAATKISKIEKETIFVSYKPGQLHMSGLRQKTR